MFPVGPVNINVQQSAHFLTPELMIRRCLWASVGLICLGLRRSLKEYGSAHIFQLWEQYIDPLLFFLTEKKQYKLWLRLL